jgi:hypothetical protein
VIDFGTLGMVVANNDAATVLQGSATADEQAKSSLRLSPFSGSNILKVHSKVCSFPFETVRWHTDKVLHYPTTMAGLDWPHFGPS